MSLESLNKKLEECDGLNPLDLSVEEERQYYLESLGGEPLQSPRTGAAAG